MEGIFKIYAIGKTEKSKKGGKYHYHFVTGRQNANNGDLFEKCTCVDFWTEKDFALKFLEPKTAILDVNGDFINFIEFVEG